MAWWLGIDVGGTFTDAVAYNDATGLFSFGKAPSTPASPTDGVVAVIAQMGIDLGEVERFVHGVTIGTNAILQRRGTASWMLVTRGFRDVLEIGRTNRPVLYDIKTLKQPPIIPRDRTIEVTERLYHDGSVRTALDETDVAAATALLATQPDGALAICFLHSYANPAHERRTRDLVQAALPGWYVSVSSEVLPQFREYERFNTTALNTVIGPLMGSYLARLQDSLRGRGYAQPVFITTSNGGVSTAARATRLPIGTVLSGPAGGVAAAIHLGRLVGIADMITCDMGGTSTDVCLIETLVAPMTNEQVIGGYANRTPQIAINAVGAGGGSIAWLDRGDILMVGPQSAGAHPGPACYGHGGTEPTVTDANLLLGRLDAGGRLAGGLVLDRDLALASMQAMATALGMEPHALAEGVLRIAVARMVSAIKQISVSNGYDPRDFALVAYGGAGPMHATAIADELEMDRVLVPVSPGNVCAFGALISDIRADRVLTHTLPLRQSAWAEVDAVFTRLEQEARAELVAEAVDPAAIVLRRAAGMRYLGQSWELSVDLPPGLDTIAALEAAFAEVHDRRFGHKSAHVVEIVSFRAVAFGIVAKPALPQSTVAGRLEDAATGNRPVFFSGRFLPTPTFDRRRVPAGQGISGPAIIDEAGATTVVTPGWRARVLRSGDILLERSAP